MIKRTQIALRKSKRRVKLKAKFLLRHPLLVPLVVFFVVFFSGLTLFVVFGATTQGAKDTHIVNLYVDGKKRTVSTRAKTIEDLLNRLKIPLIPEDITEPSRTTPIIEDNTQINIYRARPIAITDGNRTLTLLSAQRAPRLLAIQAGISLLPQDKVYYDETPAQDTLASSASERLVIKRSVEVQLSLFGVITKIRSTASNVGDLLKEHGINLAGGETVQPQDKATAIRTGMLISVNKPGTKTLAVTEVIQYKTDFLVDSTLASGKTRIDRHGVKGEQAVIYEIVEKNGVEVSRRKLQRIITIKPINEIRVRGIKIASLNSNVSVSGSKSALMATAGISASDYSYVDYIITRESNWRPGAFNSGSGAYGLCQSLPASKMASAGGDYLTNPTTQLRWCSNYALRYGGWQGAYNAWLAQGWW